jgi:Holliday junction resolvase RusA-like endonuclease
MSKTFKFFIPGDPVAKKYGFTSKGIQTNSKRARTWEKTVAQYALSQAVPGYKKPFGIIKMALDFRFAIPKSRKELIPGMPHLQDPDLTNLVKSTEDGLKKVLFQDDCMVALITAYKAWDAPGNQGVEVQVTIQEPLDGNPSQSITT